MRLSARLAIAAGLALAGVAAFVGFSAMPAAEPAPSVGTGNGPVVVELFTSQACSSCPPAEALFRDYAQRKDLIALEWHVDYWDTLNVPGSGKWRDPYSSPAWTQRQTAYNQRIRGSSGSYTPQAVIGGRSEATGFDGGAITRKIGDARKAQPDIRITATLGKELSFTIEGAPAGTEATLVTFRNAATTQVKGGENSGRKLSSAHLVTGARGLGSGVVLTAPPPAAGEGCALILHGKNQGPILAGTYCPA